MATPSDQSDTNLEAPSSVAAFQFSLADDVPESERHYLDEHEFLNPPDAEPETPIRWMLRLLKFPAPLHYGWLKLPPIYPLRESWSDMRRLLPKQGRRIEAYDERCLPYLQERLDRAYDNFLHWTNNTECAFDQAKALIARIQEKTREEMPQNA